MRKTIGRDLPNGDYLEITVKVPGDDQLYWSVVGDGWRRHPNARARTRARLGRDMDYAGQCVDEMRQAAPELEPLLLVHLADADGKPLYALANGWYFYSGAADAYDRQHYGQGYLDRRGTAHEVAAHCLHIDTADLPEGMDNGQFDEFVRGLTPRWAEQVAEAQRVFDSLVDGDGVEDR